MALLFLFGLAMFIFGSLMLLKPLAFARGIEKFSEKAWFHGVEIISRLTLGMAFILFASQSSYPKLMYGIAAILCFAAVFLLLIGEQRHKQFARKTTKIGRLFRPLGIAVQLCSGVLMYLSLQVNV